MPSSNPATHRYLWLALVGLGSLAMEGAWAQEWKVQELGTPIDAVNYENSAGALAGGPGGEGTMFYTSFYRSTGTELVGRDFRRKIPFHQKLPSNGGYGIAVGHDGSIYVGGVNPGNLYRYQPRTDELTTISLKPFGVQYIWDLATAPDGRIYCAAGYPKTNLVVYDPASTEVADLGELAPGEQYLRSLCVDAHGKVWCGIGMKAHLIVYDPITGTRQEVLPAEYAGSSSVYDLEAVGDYVIASVYFDNVLLVFDAATQKVLRTIAQPKDQKSWLISAGGSGHTAWVYTLPANDAYRCDLRDGSLALVAERLGQVKVVEADRWLHAMDDQSYLVYDLQEKRTVARETLTPEGDGMEVFTLTSGPDGRIYGSTYINMHLFRCEPATGRLTDLGKATRWAGQVDSLSLGRDGRIYVGAYTDAVVSVYDPLAPWNPGLKADSNPREIGPVGKGQYRTTANCLGPDGRIYVGSIPSYRSAEAGAFTMCDPKTGAMDVRQDFVAGGAVLDLVADDRFVYGTGKSEFFVYDPATRKKVFSENRVVISLALMNGGRVAGSGGGKLFVYDRDAGRITSDQANPAGDFTHLATGPDGSVVGVNAKCVARIAADGASAEILVNEGGKFAAVDGEGRIYFARGAKLLRCMKP